VFFLSLFFYLLSTALRLWTHSDSELLQTLNLRTVLQNVRKEKFLKTQFNPPSCGFSHLHSLLYIEVWKIRWKVANTIYSHLKLWLKSPMIFCLIWLLSYEGSISNAFLVWRNISTCIVVILVLLQRHEQSSGGSGCTIRTIVLCQRSW